MKLKFSSVNNFYERLVFEYILYEMTGLYKDQDEEFFLDVTCYALTRLPARYFRHEIDMVYYLTDDERSEMQNLVKDTVTSAAEYIYKVRTEKVQALA